MNEPLRTPPRGPVAALVAFCLDNPFLVTVLTVAVIGWGVIVAPFDWNVAGVARDPVPVDAIPDLGENQQIILTEWPGRSPQDVDDQVTYPLTVSLLGMAGVKTVRSTSMFGLSMVYVIFDDSVEFYWSRSRVLEKLQSLPRSALPEDVTPRLGPDASALGQVFWYTLEGRDREGRPTGGWDLHELRSAQDFIVSPRLASASGVAEVASIGGFVKEWQVDVDPDAMRAAGVSLHDVIAAVRASNLDVGARTLEINRAEYLVRGLGRLEDLEDLEWTTVRSDTGDIVLLREFATVGYGPALRRGALTRSGQEAVGGVVVVRHGENPLAVIENVKQRIAEIAPGLPSKILDDGTESRMTVVPFYDRTTLIRETLDTLNSAIVQQILVTVAVVVLLLLNLRSSLLVSSMLPLTVLMTFIGMKHAGVDANIVALSGIAIAVGSIVDMGIVLVENIVRRLEEVEDSETTRDVILRATHEVGSAVLTAVLTTVVSFLPVFTMVAAEGKLFRPLAATKTFALLASIFVALVVLPPAALALFRNRRRAPASPRRARWKGVRIANVIAVAVVLGVLASAWAPLGPREGWLVNLLLVLLLVVPVILVFVIFGRAYPRMLAWALDHKHVALAPAALVVLLGWFVWQGAAPALRWLPEAVRASAPVVAFAHAFPGLGAEFMPALDEGSFLYMPTTMPHASIGEALDVVGKLDRAILSVPEVESAVGKIGRVESALDPADLSMVETVIEYRDEFGVDAEGNVVRQWRDEIRSTQDIWDAIVAAAQIPGTTSAPKLQPIETRLVMLQTGFRAPMGVKVYGPDLQSIDSFGLALGAELENVPSVLPAAVFAERVVGKPYLEIDIDRGRIARYGISIADVQEVIEVAIGGAPLSMTVEGRERYAVRVRYARERRDELETLGTILVPTYAGQQIPLGELAIIEYRRGPQMIKTEDTFLVSYVIFDRRPGYSEVQVVDQARAALEAAIEEGRLVVPDGVSYRFAGSYENQVRASEKLRLVLPVAFLAIVVLLYLQFRSLSITAMVFSGVFVAWGGGFLMLWLYGQAWFLDTAWTGLDLRELMRVQPFNLSVAVWVGFLALFGIATDDGVVMATRIRQRFEERRPTDVAGVREATVEGAHQRIRAALMTSATTILALLPVLTSTGRGSDVMVPMAIPTFGGMTVALLTLFVVPILFAWQQERRVRREGETLS